MRNGLFALAAVGLACGGAPVATGSGPSTPATAGDGQCTAELTTDAFAKANHREAPEGWTAVGKLVVEMKDGRPSRMELRDASGKALDSLDATGTNEDVRELMKGEACKVGGVLLMAPEEPSKTDPRVTLLIVRPVAPDEGADLRLMCSGPPDPLDKNDDFDADQKRVIAVQIFGEKLTSPKWRRWLYDMRSEARAAKDLGPVWRARSADLRGAQKDCWFATVLEER